MPGNTSLIYFCIFLLVIFVIFYLTIVFFLDKIAESLENIDKSINYYGLNGMKPELDDKEDWISEEDPEESLFLTKDGNYSYKAFAENKKKREKLQSDEYIDDFEKSAEEMERSQKC